MPDRYQTAKTMQELDEMGIQLSPNESWQNLNPRHREDFEHDVARGAESVLTLFVAIALIGAALWGLSKLVAR